MWCLLWPATDSFCRALSDSEKFNRAKIWGKCISTSLHMEVCFFSGSRRVKCLSALKIKDCKKRRRVKREQKRIQKRGDGGTEHRT